MSLSKQALVDIFHDTMIYASRISSDFSESIKINTRELFIDRISIKNYYPLIIVVNQDIIETILLTEEYSLVLNLASYKNHGGGVKFGSMAQEEEISRKTDYMKHQCDGLYPMSFDEMIFTSNIKVIKDEKYNKLKLSQIKEFDMLAVAAIKNPQVINNKLLTHHRNITYNKIEGIFKFAIMHNYEVLILGALGCGAYHNPPEEIINIYNECIIKYGNNFKKIIFSIYSTRDDNYEKFNNYIIRSI